MATAKKVKYDCSYKKDYEALFDFVTASQKGSSFAYCNVCSKDFKISHGGKNDITEHASSANHKSNSRIMKSTPKINTIFAAGDELNKV